MDSLNIGKLARLAGVPVGTIRFYEREGLIAEPPRKPSGYRQYPADAVSRVRFIKRAKELGFSLREVAELISIRGEPRDRCAKVRFKAEAKLEEIENKIQTLTTIRNTLGRLVEECELSGAVTNCPILEALDTSD